MDFFESDQTQAITFDDVEEEDLTDELDSDGSKKPVAFLKVLLQPGLRETTYPLYEGDNIVGRSPDSCHIWISSKSLSKEHACIQIINNVHMIFDKQSRNKTRRGKLFLHPEVRYELKDNDEIFFADVKCIYLIENEESRLMLPPDPSDVLAANTPEKDKLTAVKTSVAESKSVEEDEKFQETIEETVLSDDDSDPDKSCDQEVYYVATQPYGLQVQGNHDNDTDDDDDDASNVSQKSSQEFKEEKGKTSVDVKSALKASLKKDGQVKEPSDGTTAGDLKISHLDSDAPCHFSISTLACDKTVIEYQTSDSKEAAMNDEPTSHCETVMLTETAQIESSQAKCPQTETNTNKGENYKLQKRKMEKVETEAVSIVDSNGTLVLEEKLSQMSRKDEVPAKMARICEPSQGYQKGIDQEESLQMLIDWKGFNKCPILNCEIFFDNPALLSSHISNLKHSPINPTATLVNGVLPTAVSYLCPTCGNIYLNESGCLQHMINEKHDILLSPIPFLVFTCPQCLAFFPTLISATHHMDSRKHHKTAFRFTDDQNNRIQPCPIPMPYKIMEQFILRCQQADYVLHCENCLENLHTPCQLQFHLYNKHTVLSKCHKKKTLVEIFKSLLTRKSCVECKQLIAKTIPKNERCFHISCPFQGLVVNLRAKSLKEFMRRSGVSEPNFKTENEMTLQARPQKSNSWLIMSKEEFSKCAQSKSKSCHCIVLPVNKSSCQEKNEVKCIFQPIDVEEKPEHPRKMKSITDLDEKQIIFLSNMDRIVFADLENFAFLRLCSGKILPRTFIWGFLSAREKKERELERFLSNSPLYQALKQRNVVKVTSDIGNTKEAADIVICMTIAKLDEALPPSVSFIIVSKDRGFAEVERQMANVLRKVSVICPTDHLDFSDLL